MSETKPTPRPGGLGRGLAALLGDESRDAGFGAPSQDQLLRVPIGLIQPNPHQPRVDFEPTAITELSESIRLHGVLSPLLVRREGAGFVLLAGERRLRAAGMAGLTEVPVFVRSEPAGAVGQLELALIENLMREDLNVVEAARGYQKLIQDHGYTQDKVAQRVGRARVSVTHALSVLRLPDAAITALRNGVITAGHAKPLLGLDDPAQVAEVVAAITARDLSVRATEELVRSLKSKPRSKPEPDRATVRLGHSLTRALGTHVAINARKGGKGRIVIDYHNADELDRLVGLLDPRR